MANLSGMIDAMLKEYLVFRGFTSTLKVFENEIKSDKDRSFRVEKIVEHLQLMIVNYDLAGLKHYWSHLDRRFFSKLSHEAYKNVNKLETSLLRLYLVHAIQNSKQDKVIEFFEKCASELHNVSTWKDWFAIPFLKNPEQNPMFSIYFTRVWQDSVMVAVYNCINTVFSNITLPSILNFEKDKERLERLNEENRELRVQMMTLQGEIVSLQTEKRNGKKSIAVQTNSVSLGDECDYLVVNTKTVASKPTASPPVKKYRWKKTPKEPKEPKASKPKEETSLLKKKKKPSIDKQENEQELQKMKPETVSEMRKVISNDLVKPDSLSLPSPVKEMPAHQASPAKDLTAATTPQGKPKDVSDSFLTGSLDHFTDENRKPFIILSQDQYNEHLSPVVDCRFSANGGLVSSIDTDGVIKLWECHPAPSTVATVTTKPQALCFEWVAKMEGRLLYGNFNGKIFLYDVAAKKSVLEGAVDSKYQRIVALASSPTGTSFMCSTSSGFRKRSESFSLTSSKRLTKLQSLQSLTEGSKPSNEGTIFQWDMKTFKEQTELGLDPYPVCIHCMSYNHNGTLLVTGGADGMIRLFDMRTCDCLVGWHAHGTDVVDVQFTVDETSLYSLGADGKLCIWDVHKVSYKTAEFKLHNDCTGLHAHFNSTPTASSLRLDQTAVGRLLAFDTDGKYMLTCAPNSALMYLADSKQSLEEVMSIPGENSIVSALDWNSSPHCSICVMGQANGVVQVSSLLRR